MVFDLSEKRLHHEIYLSDPRKCSQDKNRCVIRYPIKKNQDELYSVNVRKGLLNEPISIKFPSGSAM